MALILAVKHNRIEIVEFLLQRPKLNVNLQNEYGKTALAIALENDSHEIVFLLESYK